MTIRNRRAVEIRVDELREAGYTIREIAEDTGVSVGSVHNILEQIEAEHEERLSRWAAAQGFRYRPLPRPTVKQVNRIQRRRREINRYDY